MITGLSVNLDKQAWTWVVHKLNTCLNLTCKFGCKALCAMTRRTTACAAGKWATPQDSMCVLMRKWATPQDSMCVLIVRHGKHGMLICFYSFESCIAFTPCLQKESAPAYRVEPFLKTGLIYLSGPLPAVWCSPSFVLRSAIFKPRLRKWTLRTTFVQLRFSSPSCES